MSEENCDHRIGPVRRNPRGISRACAQPIRPDGAERNRRDERPFALGAWSEPPAAQAEDHARSASGAGLAIAGFERTLAAHERIDSTSEKPEEGRGGEQGREDAQGVEPEGD